MNHMSPLISFLLYHILLPINLLVNMPKIKFMLDESYFKLKYDSTCMKIPT